MFLTAPKLVDVNFTSYSFPVVLPWKQVRSFKAERSSVTGCLEVLRQSPNLLECHLESVYTVDGLIPDTPLLHSQLKHLHVELDNSWSMSLFDGITLPSLSNLYIQYNLNRGLLSLSSVTSLVIRSACNLERLTIKFPFDIAELIPCLEATPFLTYVHLVMLSAPGLGVTGLTRNVVSFLDPLNNPSRILLPNLEHLVYGGRVLCDFRAVVDMLAHRRHLSDDDEASQSIFTTKLSKLKVVELSSDLDLSRFTADVQEILRKLLEDGMTIRWNLNLPQ